MKKETDIIERFLRAAKKTGQPLWITLHPWTVKILSGDFPPEIDVNEFNQSMNVLLVGEGWLNDRMWSKIMAARIKGEIEIRREDGVL